MPFVAAKCPQCGGDLQLDNQMETGFCMHCGSKIVVQEAVRKVQVDNSQMIQTWLKMAASARAVNNLEEAYEYYKKVVENDPDNWEAIFYKAAVAGRQSTVGKDRMGELLFGIDEASKIIEKSNLSIEETNRAKILFTNAISRCAFIIHSNSFQGIKIPLMMEDLRLIMHHRIITDHCIGYLDKALSFLEGIDNETIFVIDKDTNKTEKVREIKKALMDRKLLFYYEICLEWPYYRDQTKKICYYYGLSATEKEPYIAKYDELVSEIRRLYPGFDNTHNSRNYINRLNPSKNNQESTNLLSENIRLEGIANQQRKIREVDYQKKLFFEEHPEEYKIFLDNEKRKEDVINRLKQEINEKLIQVKQIEKRVEELKKEREKLGIFAGNQKKAINEKISALELELSGFKDRIEVLKHF